MEDHGLEVQLLTSEYDQLLEEIREAGRASWVPWSAYLTATAALLAFLTPGGLVLFFEALSMFVLGLLVGLYVFKLRRANNLNYMRIWEIEYRWKQIVGTEGVGARWNPRDWKRLDDRWKYRLHFLGAVDFGLMFFTGIVGLTWLALGIASLLQVTLSNLNWAWLAVGIALVSGILTLIVGWPSIAQERRVHAMWRDEHPALQK